MRLRARAGADFTDAYADNGLNQYTAAGGLAVSHEARGNTTDIGAEAYGFNARNQLTTANAGDSLSYDPAGRLYEESATATTRFQYAGGEAIAEEDGAGAVLRRYVKGAGVDETLVWYEGSGTTDRRWLVGDVRGSVVAVTDSAGAASDINTYDEYGVPGAGNGGRFQYTGQMWLASQGLYHYKARSYNPATGRFMQTDPILYGDGMNIYNYAGNDPVNARDPSGLSSHIDDIIVVTGTRPNRNYDSGGPSFPGLSFSGGLPSNAPPEQSGREEICQARARAERHARARALQQQFRNDIALQGFGLPRNSMGGHCGMLCAQFGAPTSSAGLTGAAMLVGPVGAGAGTVLAANSAPATVALLGLRGMAAIQATGMISGGFISGGAALSLGTSGTQSLLFAGAGAFTGGFANILGAGLTGARLFWIRAAVGGTGGALTTGFSDPNATATDIAVSALISAGTTANPNTPTLVSSIGSLIDGVATSDSQCSD